MSNICAIAVFFGKISGTVRFCENSDKTVTVDVNLTGLGRSTKHGFHIHEYGDMSDKCESMCAHFNPYNEVHGGLDSKHRHVGDLGNLVTDKKGVAKYSFVDNMIKLRGTKSNIIGRGLIIHADPDDCGLGENTSSLINGNSGKRIACAVIGICSNPNH